jgi:hypothetical protein
MSLMIEAEASAERVLCRLLRGGTWEGLANEIAWTAVRAAGADPSDLGWLAGLVQARLSERVEGLEFVLERVRRSGSAEHLRQWPHDLAGAETAAEVAADEEGARHVSRLYVEVLEWACDLLDTRLERRPRPRRLLLARLRRQPLPEVPELPTLVVNGLTLEPTRYGWPVRRRDDDAARPEAA